LLPGFLLITIDDGLEALGDGSLRLAGSNQLPALHQSLVELGRFVTGRCDRQVGAGCKECHYEDQQKGQPGLHDFNSLE
jgi:hypothetical protein